MSIARLIVGLILGGAAVAVFTPPKKGASPANRGYTIKSCQLEITDKGRAFDYALATGQEHGEAEFTAILLDGCELAKPLSPSFRENAAFVYELLRRALGGRVSVSALTLEQANQQLAGIRALFTSQNPPVDTAGWMQVVDGVPKPPKNPDQIEQPARGYTIGPDCGPLSVQNPVAALAYARQIGRVTPVANWSQVLWDGCAAQIWAQARPFFYDVMHAAFWGAVDNKQVQLADASKFLFELRLEAQAANIDTGGWRRDLPGLADPPPDPKQGDTPARGYSIGPECGPLLVHNQAAALAYARQIGKFTPIAQWGQVIWDGCAAVLWEKEPVLFYTMMHAAFVGAVENGKVTALAANEWLLELRLSAKLGGQDTAAWPRDLPGLSPGPDPQGKQPARGYSIAPDCGPLVVYNEVAALAYGRQIGKAIPVAQWKQVLWDGCLTEMWATAPRFFYLMMHAAYWGAVSNNKVPKAEANMWLLDLRAQALDLKIDITGWPTELD